jgi:hypothetical protein
MLEFIISSLITYFFGLKNGITSFVLLKSLFNNNYKLSLFWLINLFTYMFLGPSYILFAKIYLVVSGLIFLHKQININEHIQETILNKLKKVKEIYNFINLVLSIPFYIIYDNANYLLINSGLKKKLIDNEYYKKCQENLQIVSDIKNMNDTKFNFSDMKFPEFPEIPDINKLVDYKDEELEKMLDDMLNPNKFLNMTNEMRKNIGKTPLNENDMINKISNFESLFGMFNTSGGFNDITNSLKDFNSDKIKYKNT